MNHLQTSPVRIQVIPTNLENTPKILENPPKFPPPKANPTRGCSNPGFFQAETFPENTPKVFPLKKILEMTRIRTSNTKELSRKGRKRGNKSLLANLKSTAAAAGSQGNAKFDPSNPSLELVFIPTMSSGLKS